MSVNVRARMNGLSTLCTLQLINNLAVGISNSNRCIFLIYDDLCVSMHFTDVLFVFMLSCFYFILFFCQSLVAVRYANIAINFFFSLLVPATNYIDISTV